MSQRESTFENNLLLMTSTTVISPRTHTHAYTHPVCYMSLSFCPDSILHQLFIVRFLGSMEVRSAESADVISETMRQILAARAIHNIFRMTESHLLVTCDCLKYEPTVSIFVWVCRRCETYINSKPYDLTASWEVTLNLWKSKSKANLAKCGCSQRLPRAP